MKLGITGYSHYLSLSLFRRLEVFSPLCELGMCTTVTTYAEHPCGAVVFSGRSHVGVGTMVLDWSDFDSFSDRLRPEYLRGKPSTYRTTSWPTLHDGVPAIVRSEFVHLGGFWLTP